MINNNNNNIEENAAEKISEVWGFCGFGD